MTSVSVVDIPCTAAKDNRHILADGLIRRRVMIFLKGTSKSQDQAEKLANWVTNLADIEGIVYATCDDVNIGSTAISNSSSALTWSTTTLTYNNHLGLGKQEICLIGRLT